jgi:hypothetical protein
VQPLGHSGGQLEAEVQLLGLDVQEEVTRGGRRHVPLTADLGERVQVRRPRAAAVHAVPGVAADAHDARQAGLDVAEADRPGHALDVGEDVAHGVLAARLDRQDEEDGRTSQRRGDGLGLT